MSVPEYVRKEEVDELRSALDIAHKVFAADCDGLRKELEAVKQEVKKQVLLKEGYDALQVNAELEVESLTAEVEALKQEEFATRGENERLADKMEHTTLVNIKLVEDEAELRQALREAVEALENIPCDCITGRCPKEQALAKLKPMVEG